MNFKSKGGIVMRKNSRISYFIVFSIVICICLFFLTPAHAKSVLNLYSASADKVMNMYNEAFKKKYPDIELTNVNLSSGPMTSRIIAEKNNPLGDLCFGMYDVYIKKLKQEGCLEPYVRKDVDKIDKRFVDTDGFYVGDNIGLIAVGVNTKIMKEKNLPNPKTWDDLVKPIYKGMIMVASPAQSGTGVTIFSNLYDMYGGWDYIDKLHKNVFQYTQSGSAPIRSTARGEIAIGITYDYAIWNLKNEGFPLDVIYIPKIPYFVEYSGLISGAKHPKEAKVFLDFMATKECMEFISKAVTLVTRLDVTTKEAWKPKLKDLDLYQPKKDYDVEKFANDWAKRYTK